MTLVAPALAGGDCIEHADVLCTGNYEDMVMGDTGKLPAREALQNLVMDEDLQRLEDLLAEFNLFDVLKIERRERQHSALLAWLLDPRGSHGLRDYFLRRFLSAAAADAHERNIANVTPLDVDGWKLGSVEVATERHNIDILIVDKEDALVCFIENKVGSGEHSDQLSKYLDTVSHEYEDLTPLPIFLTPEGLEPESDFDSSRYIPMDYGKVAALIDRTLQTRSSTISISVAGFMEQYARTLRRHVLNTADNVEELALQIYNNHRDAIDLIINAMPAADAKDWDLLDSMIESYQPLLQPDFHNKGYHRFFAPGLEEVPELTQGSGWTESNRLLLFELRYRSRRLNLIVGPGPEETRQRLYQLAQRDGRIPGVAMRKATSLSKSFHTVYSKLLLSPDGGELPDYEKGNVQVEGAVASFFTNDYWPLVNAIRAEFGLAQLPA